MSPPLRRHGPAEAGHEDRELAKIGKAAPQELPNRPA
jgi:hypothetical protein